MPQTNNVVGLLDLCLQQDASKLCLVMSSLSMTDENETQIRAAAAAADMWSKFTGIQANASEIFQNMYKGSIDTVLSALQKLH